MIAAKRFIIFSFLFLTACTQSSSPATGTVTQQVSTFTPTETATIAPTVTSTPTPTELVIPSPTPTVPPPCSPEVCVFPGHFWLARPIASQHNDQVDITYRYGSTQNGVRPTHHGVEFVNDEGTPVLAAAPGTVLVAGNDYQDTYANFPFYYGNLVIIEHDFPEYEEPVFTLYGHLSAVEVQAGDRVEVGDVVGLVGYTGIAEWSHLHFEVRVGENLFRKTRNPELWLVPQLNSENLLTGVLAGRIIDEFGTPIQIPSVVIDRLGQDGEEILETLYVETYADFTVNGDEVWGENFVMGDLVPGKYRISFVARGLQTWEVEIYPGQLTLFTFDAGEQ